MTLRSFRPVSIALAALVGTGCSAAVWQGIASGVAGASSASSPTSPFCNGFAEGWQSIKGSLGVVPICPVEPVTPVGSTPYREGIRAGVAKAQSQP